MVKFRPHTLIVETISENLDADNVELKPNYEAGQTIFGMVHPLRTEKAYSITGMELRNPMNVFVDPEYSDILKENSRVTFNGEIYYIVKPPEKYQHELTGDHARFVMEKMDSVPASGTEGGS